MTAMPTHEITVRVRYQETDGQRRVHHANYLNYFEVARTEMLRASGITYRELEDAGVILVVSEATCSYKASLRHGYEVVRDATIIASGSTVVVCVDRNGRVQRMPDWLRGPPAGP